MSVELPLLELRMDVVHLEVRLAAARGLASLPFMDDARLQALQATSAAGGPVLRQVIAERAEA
jgi:hypothetical protein